MLRAQQIKNGEKQKKIQREHKLTTKDFVLLQVLYIIILCKIILLRMYFDFRRWHSVSSR